jgi:hypothetical protein
VPQQHEALPAELSEEHRKVRDDHGSEAGGASTGAGSDETAAEDGGRRAVQRQNHHAMPFNRDPEG